LTRVDLLLRLCSAINLVDGYASFYRTEYDNKNKDIYVLANHFNSMNNKAGTYLKGVICRLYPRIKPGHILLSNETGFLKPQPEAFLQVCKASGLKPQQILVIDGQQVNINAAAALGMKCLLLRKKMELAGAVRNALAL